LRDRASRALRPAGRLGFLLGLLAALAAAAPVRAQPGDEQPGALQVAELAAQGTAHWPDLVRDAVRKAWAPLSTGFAGIWHAAERVGPAWMSGSQAHPLRMELEPVRLEPPSNLPPLGPVWNGTVPWRLDLMADSEGSGYVLNPRRFNVPWLVAPDNEFHLMPAVSVARVGLARWDLVGATLGGRTGAVVSSFVYRF
jgi:hypothetical protein